MSGCNICGAYWPNFVELSICPKCGGNPDWTDCKNGDHFFVIQVNKEVKCENCGYEEK